MIVVYVFFIILGVAVLTIRLISIVGIMSVIVAGKTSAAAAGGIIVFIAVVAESYCTVSFRFRTPDAVKTAVTECGKFVESGITHELIVEFVHGVFGKFGSAVEADVGLRHGFVLLKM